MGRASKLGTPIALAALVTLASLPASAGPRAATSAVYVARRVASTAGAGAAAGAVEFEVTGDGPFPARALDPVLHVGKVDVRDYRYQGDGSRTLVFTTPDASRLENGATVTLTYEPGNRDRIDLPALQLDAIAP